MAGLRHFCGTLDNSTEFMVWDSESKSFGSCFQWLCLTGVSHLVFAVVSAFLLGKASRRRPLPSSRSKLATCRLLLCYINAVAAIVAVILAYTLKHYHPPAFVLSRTLTFTTWLIGALLCHKLLSKSRKVKQFLQILLIPFIIILTSSSLQLYNYIHLFNTHHPNWNSDWYIPVYFGLNVVFFTLIIVGLILSPSHYSRLGRQLPSLTSTGIQAPHEEERQHRYPEEDALLGTKIDSYDSYTFGEPTLVRDSILGWAEEEAGIISKVSFHWVNPLMKKGANFLLKKSDDLFLLPLSLDTKMIKEIFQSIIRLQKLVSHLDKDESQKFGSSGVARKPTLQEGYEGKRKPLKISLSRALYRAFGFIYIAIGLLKFLADCLAFVGPILLNYLVSFMENKQVSLAKIDVSFQELILETFLVNSFLRSLG